MQRTDTVAVAKNNPQRLGEILSQHKSQLLGKPLATTKKCEVCKLRLADGLIEGTCSVCMRRMVFEALPCEQQKIELLQVVPEKYINAELGDLSDRLRGELIKDTETGFLLWGATGIGKTHAMTALAKQYISQGFVVRRTHYEMLCLRLRDTFNSKATNTEWSIIEPLLMCDKLFIEDVGTTKSIGERESDFSLRTFLILLDVRMEYCRPTFITSNKSVENLAKSFDERIGDRLSVFNVFNLGKKSRRQKQ